MILFKICLIYWGFIFHPFYVSVIDIGHNEKNKSLEISIKIFTEDFEKTLNSLNQKKINFVQESDKDLINLYIHNYIQQKLKIINDKKKLSMQFVGYEIQQESVWCYFEIEQISMLNKLDIECNILYDFTENQINIFHLKYRGKEQSYKLNFPDTHFSFTL